MNIGAIGILVIFAAFIVLLFLNPNLSCFGKKIRSPLHPILGRKGRASKRIVTEDYGFKLVEDEERPAPGTPSPSAAQQGRKEEAGPARQKPLKTSDYGFKLDD